jgi:hypothetical protein
MGFGDAGPQRCIGFLHIAASLSNLLIVPRLFLELGSRSAGRHLFPVSRKAHGLPASVALPRAHARHGEVKLRVTGEGFEMLRSIASPIELRNSITGTTDKA